MNLIFQIMFMVGIITGLLLSPIHEFYDLKQLREEINSMSKIKGKKPTYQQRKLLESYDRNPKDWLYTGQEVLGRGKSLGRGEIKVTKYKFVHRETGQEISLQE